MRLMILSVCILLCSSFMACSDNDNDNDNDNGNDNLELNVDYLNQSAWTGRYIIKEKNGKTNERYTIGFSFISKNAGSFTIFSNESEEFNITRNMKYSVDRKKLRITNYAGSTAMSLGGDWFVVEKDKDNLVLVRNKETEIYTDYLYLRRTY